MKLNTQKLKNNSQRAIKPMKSITSKLYTMLPLKNNWSKDFYSMNSHERIPKKYQPSKKMNAWKTNKSPAKIQKGNYSMDNFFTVNENNPAANTDSFSPNINKSSIKNKYEMKLSTINVNTLFENSPKYTDYQEELKAIQKTPQRKSMLGFKLKTPREIMTSRKTQRNNYMNEKTCKSQLSERRKSKQSYQKINKREKLPPHYNMSYFETDQGNQGEKLPQYTGQIPFGIIYKRKPIQPRISTATKSTYNRLS